MEYADPRDTPAESAFLNAIFASAVKDMVPAAN